MLEAAHDRARDRWPDGLSLSLDVDNPAKRLYERLGYREYQPQDDIGRMIIALQSAAV